MPHLSATGSEISGSLDLSSIRAVADRHGGVCWIGLRNARIGCSLIAARACLAGPLRQRESKSAVGYALDLRAATIGGELILWPGFIANGGVNLRSAHVSRDVLLSGATLTAGEDHALSAAGARIGGAALFNVEAGDECTQQFVANGSVYLLDAEIDGSFEARGASMGSLLAMNAKIGGALVLRPWVSGETILGFRAPGEVSFNAAAISGTVDVSGAMIGTLDAQNAKIGGAVVGRTYNGYMTSLPCHIEGDVLLASARVSGNVDFSGATVANLNMANAEIGGSMFLNRWPGRNGSHSFRATGWVRISGVSITGGFDASGATLRGLHADNATIGGAFFLRANVGHDEVAACVIEEDVYLMGCRIRGNLEMAGASIGRLLAANADIGGSALFLPSVTDDKTIPFIAAGVVSLSDAKVGGNLEMTGAQVYSLNAQNASIGGSALLRASDRGNIQPFKVETELFLHGASIHADLDLSGAQLKATALCNNTQVGGSLWLSVWAGLHLTASGTIDLSGSYVRNALIVRGLRTVSAQPVTIDVRHSAVEVLDDENGTAWGDNVTIRLEGFRYARLAIGQAHEAAQRLGSNARRWSRRSPVVDGRLCWLKMQFPLPGRYENLLDYTPDAYDRLTLAFRAAGHHLEALAITRERLRVERKISKSSFSRPFRAVYAALFDSGLSPSRAIATFVLFIFVGWGATWVADRGWDRLGIAPVLMLETRAVNSVVVPSAGEANVFRPGLPLAITNSAFAEELPCGNEIEPLLYALDVFVPALELHQEQRCRITVRPEGIYWQLARAAYSVIGWIVTALTILTVSGVARRHLER